MSTAVDNIQVKMLEGKDAGDLALLARKVRSKNIPGKIQMRTLVKPQRRVLGKNRLWQKKMQL